ncbi:uncharacterized protein LOC117324562 [Pecten maximus]|uniref:uncharacterized protein LOC117324562 n=1 Tax=Pecten maximus TaxID=6579 RepID=UPI001458C96D|nr:uncharacterized protein LOC117324562 [Pecten maximus]
MMDRYSPLPHVLLCLLLFCTTNAYEGDIGNGPWKLALKVPRGVQAPGYSSIEDLWNSANTLNDNDIGAMTDFSSGGKVYKGSITNDWGTKTAVSHVKLSAFKDGIEKAYVVFDAFGKTKTTFMDCNKVVHSSWSDLKGNSFNYCNIPGHSSIARTFFINRSYAGCNSDYGWFILKDYDQTGGCSNWDTATGNPKVMYSADSTYINWAYGNRQTGDSFAIFVLEWKMVFKGVDGVESSAGSLLELWDGSNTENANDVSAITVTKAPSKTYKSAVLEKWSAQLVDQVRYSYFTGGTEVAYTVFNGRGSDKKSWFSNANIIYSKYTDMTSKTKVACSIDGDSTRKFSIHHRYDGCPNDEIWMQVLDKRGGGAPCSWDQNVRTRPYFLYSAGTTVVTAQSGGNWNSAGFPAAETLGIFITGWTPVMKLAHGQSIGGAADVRDLWKGTYTVNEGDANAMSIAAGTKPYKSSIVDNWSDYYISAVRISFITGGKEKAFVVFDAHGADKNSWFSKARILYSSWNDLGVSSTSNYDSIDGHSSLNRHFYMNRNYGGCPNDFGWFIVTEVAGTACSWETKTNTKPYFLYSDATESELSNNQVLADVFTISVSMDMCNPNRCGNGATCIDLGATYECACSGNYFGTNCENLNGGFSNWSAYGACTMTCGSGTKTRTRTCNNPAPVGSGSACVGSTTDTTSCNIASCAINGGWSSWGGWGSCSRTCGGGTQEKTRSCTNPSPQHGGANCPNSGTASQSCNTASCPIDGGWSSWGGWGSCTVSCGGGSQQKTRSCNNPSPQHGGANCPNSATATQSCNTHNCPIDGGWSSWSGWGSCTVSCGGGSQQKTRTCSNPSRQYGGADCANNPATVTASQTCNTHNCPIDGGWTSWGSWTTCTVTCGGGSQERVRSCTNPTKQYGGADCPNLSSGATSVQACGTINCPIDGGYGSWMAWASCSVSCGGGTRSRGRLCDNPYPQYNGAQCVGPDTTSETCNTQVCIIDGGWGGWSAYGACTKTCGTGVYSRSRACDSPLPANGGNPCGGASSEFSDCNTNACPVAAAGVYQQLCPSSWFTCESGAMTCIMLSMKCDCSNDCDDGSDETTGYAGCDPELMAMCESGAEHALTSISLLVLCLVAAIYKNIYMSKPTRTAVSPDRVPIASFNMMDRYSPLPHVLIYLLLFCTTNAYEGDTGNGPWKLALKVPSGVQAPGYSSIEDLWNSANTLNDNDIGAMTDFSSGGKVYKGSITNDWGTKTAVSHVKLSAFKDGIEKAYVVFDAFGKTKTTFMDCNKVVHSSWSDLKGNTFNYCNIPGHSSIARTFFINRSYAGCNSDYGWFILKDYDQTGGCSNWDTATGNPKVMYSADSTYINWAYGNRQTGDSFAIFVLEWKMVFKGVDGVESSAGSLLELWDGSNTENANDVSAITVTKAPSKTYKSALVEKWSAQLVDQVRYSYFTGGTEVAYTVFNGRGSDKKSWFSNANIIYSKYTDITSKTKVACSIDGDSTRKFSIHHRYDGCPNDEIWMQVLDKRGGGAPCSWDQNVRTRPYFLYSAGTTVVTAQSGGNWNSAGFPAAETLGIFITGWTPVMKLAHGQSIGGAADVRDLWKGTYTVNEGDANAMSIAAGTKPYKSSIVDNWSDYYISAVRISFITGGKEKAFVVFDAHGADKNSWFSKARVLYSSWNDLGPTSTTNFDAIDGHQPHGRNFYMNRNYGGCGSDAGWFIVSEVTSYGCSWETKTNVKPYYLYSDAAGYELSNNQVLAEVFAISVSMDMCNPNRCGNGATCIDLGATYECACSGNYFGTNCENLNGGFSNWSAYGACTMTCGSGTKTRTRTCNNPSPVGSGSACVGSTTDTTSCNIASCAINGGWSSWGGWGSCSRTCGGGTQEKTRSCTNPSPQHGGANCPNSGTASQSCNTASCPIDGGWSSWGGWGSCTVSCGGGSQQKTRSCTNPSPQHGGANCPNSATASQACNTHNCPIDGGWSSWSGWGSCTVSCGGGSQQKTRSCTNPSRQYGGADCANNPATATASQTCNTHNCPIDGGWTSWGGWTTCTVTCGGGSQERVRSCTNPTKQYGGADCPNLSTGATSVQACGTINCPIDGGYGSWMAWASCSVSCGGGTRSRGRLCDNPYPQYNGAQCVGPDTTSETCNTQVCIIDGGWGGWSAFGACTKTCGTGVYSRSRACDSPLPANGGNPCSGASSEFSDCNTNACPVAAAGVYQQLCPSNWFTCESGAMTCIMLSMKCDCSNDCDDGSDETTGYAGCDPELMAMCESGAEHTLASFTLIVLCLVAAIYKNL